MSTQASRARAISTESSTSRNAWRSTASCGRVAESFESSFNATRCPGRATRTRNPSKISRSAASRTISCSMPDDAKSNTLLHPVEQRLRVTIRLYRNGEIDVARKARLRPHRHSQPAEQRHLAAEILESVQRMPERILKLHVLNLSRTCAASLRRRRARLPSAFASTLRAAHQSRCLSPPGATDEAAHASSRLRHRGDASQFGVARRRGGDVRRTRRRVWHDSGLASPQQPPAK